MAKSKMGRPPGTRNKNSWKVLEELRKNNFDIIKEVLETYGYSKEIYVPLFDQMMQNRLAGRPLTAGMTEEEVELMNINGKAMADTLKTLMSFCYPKLKAMELAAGSSEKINFSINIPVVDDETSKNKIIDLPGGEYKGGSQAD